MSEQIHSVCSSCIAFIRCNEVGTLVGKFVELFFIEGVVGSSVILCSTGESFHLGLGWFEIRFFKECSDSNIELFLGDLSVFVGINLCEDFVGLSLGDAWFFCR